MRRRRESALSSNGNGNGNESAAEGSGSPDTSYVPNTQPHQHHRGGSAGVLMKGGGQVNPSGGIGTTMTGSSAPKDWMWSTF